MSGTDIPYDIQTRPLGAAGSGTNVVAIEIRCKYIGILDATDTDNVQVSFNGARFVPLKLGMQVASVDRTRLWIKNTSGSLNTITVYLGNDEMKDNRLAVGVGRAVPVNVTNTPPINLTAIGGVVLASGLVPIVPHADLSGLNPPSKATGVSAASTNASLLLTGPRSIQGVQVFNSGVTPVYFRLYQKATAPVPGTDTPDMVLGVPAGGQATWFPSIPEYWALGLGIAITNLAPLNDATAVAANQVTWSLVFN